MIQVILFHLTIPFSPQKKSIFVPESQRGRSMENNLDIKKNSAESDAIQNNKDGQNTSSARIRKMRNWLGANGTIGPTIVNDDSEPIIYGDGHCGWNR